LCFFFYFGNTLEGRRNLMLEELAAVWRKLENQRHRMLALVEDLSMEKLRFSPDPARWSILQVIQHVVQGETSMRQSEAELRDHPLREHLQPGEMVGMVREFLEKDLVTAVPDPSMEPDGNTNLDELRKRWHEERRAMAALLEAVDAENRNRVMFSHVASGPLTALQMLEIAEAHLGTHTRQIEQYRKELPA
jgi:uncharacterized damage-inducible protein DinB